MDKLAGGARLLLALTMVFTYPMEHFVARHSLFALVWGPERGHVFQRVATHAGTTAVLFVSSVMIALNTTDLGFVLSLTGSARAPTHLVA